MLNGQCKLTQSGGKSGGTCRCDTPWTGPNCGVLGYATTPATAKSLYNISDPRNTWNGFVLRLLDYWSDGVGVMITRAPCVCARACFGHLFRDLYTCVKSTLHRPIVTGPDGRFHIYDPIYRVGSLGGPTSIKHGTAANVTGPWEWTSQPDLSTEGGENPGMMLVLCNGRKN